MKRNFCNTVTKRLISAFLVLAMVVTIIPVTDAEAKKKYQYKHDFYTVDGRKTDGHREEIINTDGDGHGLSNYYSSVYQTTDGMYNYELNAEDVKQLVAGGAITVHIDRLRNFRIFENTNVTLKGLFLEMSYTDKNGKRKENKKDFLEANCCDVFEFWAAKNGAAVTDVDITFRLPSKAIYNKYTRFELPKGEKGKKKYTYKISLWCGTKTDPDEREKQCRNNRTQISAEGIEEPIEYYLGKGKWGYMCAPLGADSAVSGMVISDKTIKNGWSFTIRGKYTHRKLTYRVVFTKKRTGKLVYDKFKHESQLGVKDAE